MTKYVVTLTVLAYGRPDSAKYTVEAETAEAAVAAAREKAQAERQYTMATGQAEVEETR
jgi:hypothetical protein